MRSHEARETLRGDTAPKTQDDRHRPTLRPSDRSGSGVSPGLDRTMYPPPVVDQESP